MSSTTNTSSPDLIKLNVGGVHYVTMRSTLTRFRDSMLAAMFTGSVPTACDEEGRYFIDRNGAMFAYVLDFLRTSQLALPDGFTRMHQLLIEADYYQIQPLLEALHELKGWQQLKNQPQKTEPQVMHEDLLEVIEIMKPIPFNETINSRRTLISGRRDIINSLPSEIISRDTTVEHVSGPLYDGCMEYTHLDTMSKNIRLCLADYLKKNGWVLVTDQTSASGPAHNILFVVTKMSFKKSRDVPKNE